MIGILFCAILYVYRNHMRKTFSFVLLLLLSYFGSAQNAKVVESEKYFDAYEKNHKEKDLLEARKHIDAAKQDISAKRDPGMWILRGKIYLASYVEKLNAQEKKLAGMSRDSILSVSYFATSNQFLATATQSFVEACMVDSAKTFVYETGRWFEQCKTHNLYSGQVHFQKSSFKEATLCFERTFSMSSCDETIDSMNMFNAALSGWKGKEYPRAIVWLTTLTGYNYEPTNSWWMLSECYLGKGDTAHGIQVLKQGITRNPKDSSLWLMLAQTYIAARNTKSADSIVMEYIGLSSTPDPKMNAKIASVYQQLAHVDGNSETAQIPKPDCWELLLARSEIYYLKALQQDPGYYEGVYNLGALYFNWGVEYYNRSNLDTPSSEKLVPKYEQKFRSAIVYLEKALAMVPGDAYNLYALKMCYAQLGDTVNFQRIRQLEKDGK